MPAELGEYDDIRASKTSITGPPCPPCLCMCLHWTTVTVSVELPLHSEFLLIRSLSQGASVSMTMYVTLCLCVSVSLSESVCIPVSVSFSVCAHTSVPMKETGTGKVCVCEWGEVYNMKYPAAANSVWVTGFQTSNLSKNRGAGIRPCRQQPGPLGEQNFYG